MVRTIIIKNHFNPTWFNGLATLYNCDYCNYKTSLLGNYRQQCAESKETSWDPDYDISKEIALKRQNEPKMSRVLADEPEMTQNNLKMSQNFTCLVPGSQLSIKRKLNSVERVA